MNEIILIQFMVLYFCNLLFDYPLQGSFLATGKSESNYLLWVHCAIWGFGMSLTLIPLGLFAWWKVIMLVCGHLIIDYWKARGLYKTERCSKGMKITTGMSDETALFVDQVLHILQIIFCFA